MLQSKKWLYIAILLPFLLVSLPFFINGNIRNGNLIYSDSTKFILDHEDSIKSEIVTHLKDEGKSVDSVKLLPNTARGEYDNGGDVSGNYHIYFTAYVNNNRERTISVELFFPDASIPPFTLFPPNPYKDKGKKMSNWLIGNIEVSEEASK